MTYLMNPPKSETRECRKQDRQTARTVGYKPLRGWAAQKPPLLNDAYFRPVPVTREHESIVFAWDNSAISGPYEISMEVAHPVNYQAFSEIEAAIRQSRHMLTLEDDWDGEGSLGYTEKVWQRAADFVRSGARRFYRESRQVLPAPQIENGPKGGIDIYWWASSGKKLLFHVPRDSGFPITFFGFDNESEVKGELLPQSNIQWLLMWLTR